MPIILHTAGGGGGAPGGGDSTYTDTYANIPAASNDGDLFFPSDGKTMFRDTGAAWTPWGPLLPFTDPPAAGWGWVNQGSATVDTTKGGIYLEDTTGAGGQVRARTRSITPPYVITAALLPAYTYGASINAVGLIFRQSSDGKLIVFHLQGGGTLQITKFSSPTVGVANYLSVAWNTAFMPTPLLILRIEDDNTNRKCYWSWDGTNFTLIHSVGRTDFLTADEVGFHMLVNNASTTVGQWLLSWEQT
jgi:hypothetical protein